VRPRAGFTLIEVTVALLIGGLTILIAHAMFGAVADQGRVLLAAREGLDREANARRWVSAAFLSLETGRESAGRFDGEPGQVEFTSWQRTPDGWFERRRVRLGLSSRRLVATVIPSGPIPLTEVIRGVDFDYLLALGAESPWVRQWVSPLTAPVAVRMRLTRVIRGLGDSLTVDTLLFLVKERG
jgi:prepilin-type N-terminal cleavage/methylation domain-containing protein